MLTCCSRRNELARSLSVKWLAAPETPTLNTEELRRHWLPYSHGNILLCITRKGSFMGLIGCTHRRRFEGLFL